jgi:polyhydroxyalkanoate synthesis repressor PhaR
MSEPRLIKKYPNRRLYDTQLSRYITLEDVRRLIAGSTPVRVIEQRSGRDITRPVLLQVISEQEQGESARLSETFLTELIRTYGQVPASATMNVLENSLHNYVQGAASNGGP